MKRLIPILFAFLYFVNTPLCISQEELKDINQASFSVHYHAFNLLHAGTELGYDTPLLKIESTNKKEKKRWYQLYCGPSLGIYNFRGNHTGITLGSDLGFKTSGQKGFEMEVFGGLHYVRAINAHETFELGSNGNFEKVDAAGNNYIQWRAGLGFGKNFLAQGKLFSINVKLGVSQTSFPSPPLTPNIWIGYHYFFKK